MGGCYLFWPLLAAWRNRPQASASDIGAHPEMEEASKPVVVSLEDLGVPADPEIQ